jgi:hypothetical protein
MCHPAVGSRRHLVVGHNSRCRRRGPGRVPPGVLAAPFRFGVQRPLPRPPGHAVHVGAAKCLKRGRVWHTPCGGCALHEARQLVDSLPSFWPHLV